jgi:hypothetical protein
LYSSLELELALDELDDFEKAFPGAIKIGRKAKSEHSW